jgi:YggT family protein
MSWLIAFNVINTHSRPVAMIGDFLYRATEPALRPIRRFLPNFGGLDISPIILLLILWFVERELIQVALVVSQY